MTTGDKGKDDGAAAEVAPRRKRVTRWWVSSRIAGVCLILLVGVVLRQPSTWVRLTPGPVFDLQGHISGDITNQSVTTKQHGHFSILTVAVQRETVFTHLFYDTFGDSGAELENDPDHQIAAMTTIIVPDQGDPQIQMQQAINTAASLAYSITHGTPLIDAGSLLEVVNTPGADGATAARAAGLEAGEVVTGINGASTPTPTLLHTTLTRLWTNHQSITLDVLDGARELKVHLDYSLMRKGLMGVLSIQWFANPAQLDTTFTQIGGPSGGLMTTLAFLDALNTGDLAGGKSITGTGTIASNGAIGPVGGVAEKMLSASRAGYRIFFVPKSNLAAARSTAPKDMDVIPVTKLSQAVTWLCTHGGTSAVCANPTLNTSPPLADADLYWPF
jgi:PDZ domain-containing protein